MSICQACLNEGGNMRCETCEDGVNFDPAQIEIKLSELNIANI